MAQNQMAAKAIDLQNCVDELLELAHTAAHEGTPLHELEESLFRKLLTVGRGLLQLVLDVAGTGDIGETCQLEEGPTWRRLPDTHTRSYMSIFGEFEITRHVYGTREGQKIEFVPLDARFALPPGKFSYLLQDWDQSLVMEQPFAETARSMEKILGLRQHVDSLEQMNRQMAAAADAYHTQQAVPPAKEEGAILVQSADGKGVPIRHAADTRLIEEHRGRSGPKPDRKKMATLGAVYSIDPHVRTPEEVVESLFRQPGTPREKSNRPRPCHKRVRGSLNYVDPDGELLRGAPIIFDWMAAEVAARNPDGRKPVVCLMDGQESLWGTRDLLQKDVPMIDILDLLHVTPRLWKAARVFHTVGSAAAEQFVRERVLRILRGEVTGVIRGLRRMATDRLQGKSHAGLETICNYFDANRHRMRYHEYLAAGYPIASGVIEGACRNVVKDRLERTGMSWIVPGAQSMLQLRCLHLADDWENYQKYRTQQEIRRLYPHRDRIHEFTWAIAV